MRHKEIFGLAISGKSLLEAPQTIDGTDFGMSNADSRYQYTRHLLSLSPKLIEDTDTYELMKCSDGDHTYYFMLEKPYGSLVYFVKCEPEHFDFIGQTVTQIALWRDLTSFVTQGISDHVFFDLLLSNYPTIMSDEQQTSRGRDFWIIRMAKAPKLGLRIGLADIENKIVKWRDENTSASSWIQQNEHAWSRDETARNIRFIISK